MNDAKITVFQRNLRKFPEILQKFCCKFSENLSEKTYTLNPSGGNSREGCGVDYAARRQWEAGDFAGKLAAYFGG